MSDVGKNVTNPLEIMDEITTENSAFGGVCVTRDEWFTIRKAVEAQAEKIEGLKQSLVETETRHQKALSQAGAAEWRGEEELAQARARIARLQRALSLAASAIKSGERWTSICQKEIGGVLNESYEQSLAAVKAETLRQAADLIEDQWDHQDAVNLLRDEAESLEHEAQEKENE